LSAFASGGGLGLAACLTLGAGRGAAQAVASVNATARVLPEVGWDPARRVAGRAPLPGLTGSVAGDWRPGSRALVAAGPTPLVIGVAIVGRRRVVEVAVLGS
jgi:hypothetical protein